MCCNAGGPAAPPCRAAHAAVPHGCMRSGTRPGGFQTGAVGCSRRLLPSAFQLRPLPPAAATTCSHGTAAAAHARPHLAAEAAEVLGVLANFDLLDLLPQRSAIAGAVLADDPNLLGTLRLQVGRSGKVRAAAVRRQGVGGGCCRRLGARRASRPIGRPPRRLPGVPRSAGRRRREGGAGRRRAWGPHRCLTAAGDRGQAAAAARRPAAPAGAARALRHWACGSPWCQPLCSTQAAS